MARARCTRCGSPSVTRPSSRVRGSGSSATTTAPPRPRTSRRCTRRCPGRTWTASSRTGCSARSSRRSRRRRSVGAHESRSPGPSTRHARTVTLGGEHRPGGLPWRPRCSSAGGQMASGFHEGSRSLQDRFDTRALADRIDGLLVSDTISDGDRAFIEARDMFFLATADAEGRPTCSYKGGEPGFVRVLDAAHAGLSQLRRQRHVPVDGQRAGQPGRRDAVHRLRAGAPDAARGHGEHRPRRPVARRTTRRPSSSSGSEPARSTRTARATSTATSSYGGRGSCPAATA